MNCQNFQIIVHDLASGRLIEETAKAQADVHGAACEACSIRLRDEQNLTNALRELSSQMDSEAPARVKQTVMAEFRSLQAHRLPEFGKTGKSAFPLFFARNSPRYRTYAAAAAVVLMVAMAAAAIRIKQSRLWPGSGVSSPVAKQEEAGPQIVAVAENAPPIEETSDDPPARPKPKRIAAHRVSAKPRAARYSVSVRSLGFQPAAFDEVTTDFIPLAYSTRTVQEGGQVMRVEMPRYAMARFGVPVNVERYDERVKADLWVGLDGLAHAIRFVQ